MVYVILAKSIPVNGTQNAHGLPLKRSADGTKNVLIDRILASVLT